VREDVGHAAALGVPLAGRAPLPRLVELNVAHEADRSRPEVVRDEEFRTIVALLQ
jgi:hypothetical protein